MIFIFFSKHPLKSFSRVRPRLDALYVFERRPAKTARNVKCQTIIRLSTWKFVKIFYFDLFPLGGSRGQPIHPPGDDKS